MLKKLMKNRYLIIFIPIGVALTIFPIHAVLLYSMIPVILKNIEY